MPMSLKAWEHLKLDLWAESLRGGDSVALKAWGTSMLPCVWPGDILTIRNLACEEAIPGDIVLVLQNSRVFIHRLVEKLPGLNGYSWITKGDAIPQNDPAVMELFGRVVEIRRGARTFVPSRQISRMQSATAWMLCRSDRLRNLALHIHESRTQMGSVSAGRLVRRLFGTLYSALAIRLSRTVQG
jgi:Peptidase S24-like